MRRPTRPVAGAIAALAVVAVAALGGLAVVGGVFDSSDEQSADTTTSTASAGSDTTTASTALDTTTSTAPAVVDDLSDVAWVVNDFDGLIDNRGRVLMMPDEPPVGGAATVARAGDGSIWYVADGALWHWPLDASGSEQVETEADGVSDVGYLDGNIVVDRYGAAEVVAGAGDRRRPDAQLQDEAGAFITASNGITVRVLEADADVDELGSVTNVRSPARLQVEREGEIEWTIDAGGVDAPWLSLIDFDGQRVMMARFPTEPADPMLQHIVYDLNCASSSSADGAPGRGCTHTFWARYGKASLVGPDVSGTQLNTQLLDVCPTMLAEIPAPAEMTDPETFAFNGSGPGFTADERVAFEETALRLATCDPSRMGAPGDDGLAYDPDVEGSGWLWIEYAEALSGPFTVTGDSEWTWEREAGGPSVVMTGAAASGFVEPVVMFEPTRQPSQPRPALAVAPDSTVPDEPAELSAAAAEAFAEPGSFGEVHLIDGEVTSIVYPSADPSDTERDLGFAFADFASGGESSFEDLRFADEVLMALGPTVYANRSSAILFRRPAWTINAASFSEFSGPFNLLDSVPAPSQVVVGPHQRCAGAGAVPSPPELVEYRRIAILPAEESIESCIDWAAIDLFVDDDGVIHGVALDLFGP